MINSIGIILCAYGNPKYVKPCLEPWLKLKHKYNIKIAGVHGQFKEYHENLIIDADTETLEELLILTEMQDIDYLYVQNDYWVDDEYIYETEAQIRDRGLQWLLKENCDAIWLLDLDEFYTEEQIENIINYINSGANSWNNWFSIPMKNYIFSGKEYIKGFNPPRIFKVNPLGDLTYKLHSFYWDNDLIYKDGAGNKISYKELSSISVPENLINNGVKHLTWLHSNGKKKVEYQITHFGHCSYKWNEDKKELEIDYDFFRKNNLPFPIISKDE